MARRYPVEPRIRSNCGTRGGYSEHYRRGERPCDACKTVARDYAKRYRDTGRDANYRKRGYGGCVRSLGWPREPEL